MEAAGHSLSENRVRAQWSLLRGARGPSRPGARTPEGLQRISEANFKHGRQTKEKLAAQRHAAKVGRWVRGELKRIERQLFAAVKRCVSAIINDTHFYLARLCYLVD